MTLDEYQEAAGKTAQYPRDDQWLGLIYTTLGLTNEAGEFAGKLKKLLRGDDNGVLTSERKVAMVHELGDVLWYLTQTATELGVTLDEVARTNVEKLARRQQIGTLNGDGDNR